MTRQTREIGATGAILASLVFLRTTIVIKTHTGALSLVQ